MHSCEGLRVLWGRSDWGLLLPRAWRQGDWARAKAQGEACREKQGKLAHQPVQPVCPLILDTPALKGCRCSSCRQQAVEGLRLCVPAPCLSLC